MGDFNAANNPIVDRSNNSTKTTKRMSHSWRLEISLFSYLENLGFSDVHKDWKEIIIKFIKTLYIYKNKNAYSRIDYIWTNQKLAIKNLHLFNNTEFDHITNSNYILLKLLLYN